MTVVVYSKDVAGRKFVPVKKFNVLSIHDEGDSTVTLKNAFGGSPQTHIGVDYLRVEPEREE